MRFINVLQRVVIVLVLLFVAMAITPPDKILACTFGTGEKIVTQKLVETTWSVNMTAAVKVDNCGHIKLAWASCVKNALPGYTVRVTWCSAYYPNGISNSTKIDVGFNASISGTRSFDVWSRRWVLYAGGPQPQRSGKT